MIVVALKPVPDPASPPEMEPQTLSPKRTGFGLVANPVDRHALSLALDLRDSWPAAGDSRPEVVAVAMAPPEAEQVLRQALAVGADRAVLLSDPAFAGSDTLATARCLAAAVRRLSTAGSCSDPGGGDRDLLIVTGESSSDSGTGHVGPQLATLLGLGWVPFVTGAEWDGTAEADGFVGKAGNAGGAVGPVGAPVLRLTTRQEPGLPRWRLSLPGLITVGREVAPARPVTFTGVVRARRRPLEVLGAAALGLAARDVGLQGSPSRTVSWREAPAGPGGLTLQGSLDEMAAELSRLLRAKMRSLAGNGPPVDGPAGGSAGGPANGPANGLTGGRAAEEAALRPGEENGAAARGLRAEPDDVGAEPRAIGVGEASGLCRGAVLAILGLGRPARRTAQTRPSRETGTEAGLIAVGRNLADRAGRNLVVLDLSGDDPGTRAAAGASTALVCRGDWTHPVVGPHRLATLLGLVEPWAVLLPAERSSSVLAAATAARLGTSLVAGAVALEYGDDFPSGEVPALGGYANIACPGGRPPMFTVRAEAVEASPPGRPAHQDSGAAPGGVPPVTVLDLSAFPGPVSGGPDAANPVPAASGGHSDTAEQAGQPASGRNGAGSSPGRIPLTTAAAVVVGGAGAATAEGWALLERLAGLLGAALGATRPCVDAGLADENRMIGHSGVTVRPELYVGVGVSGDVQHTIGLGRVGFLAAVNTDTRCRLAGMSDVLVPADLYEFLPLLIDNLAAGADPREDAPGRGADTLETENTD